MIVFNEKQKKGIEIAVERFKNNEAYTCIAGYAGTGKTTLVRAVIDALGVSEDDVVYTALAGRAAAELKRRGCKNSQTLHSLLYKTRKTPNGFVFIPKASLDEDYRIIVLDEISMVPHNMIELLASHKVHVLCLGDPFQLPPPVGADNGILQNPHIFLDEIMRQKGENPIVDLSFAIRSGEKITPEMSTAQTIILTRDQLAIEHLMAADQVICAQNKTRRMFNSVIRTELGRTQLIEPLEKLICLRNVQDFYSETGDTLVNGLIATSLGKPMYANPVDPSPEKAYLRLRPEYIEEGQPGVFENVVADLRPLHGIDITKDTTRSTLGKKDMSCPIDYGYVITCHKAQGGEWPKVLVLEEAFPHDSEEHRRWLYTAVTRAQEKVCLVLKD